LFTLIASLWHTEFESCLQRQVLDMKRSRCLEPNLGVPFSTVAIDGKTPWVGRYEANPYCQRQQSGSPGGKASYLFRVLRAVVTSSRVHATIWQEPIEANTNDMGAFPAMWDALMQRYGHTDLIQVATMDAGFTSLANAHVPRGRGRRR
jgi:hypothetical protein